MIPHTRRYSRTARTSTRGYASSGGCECRSSIPRLASHRRIALFLWSESSGCPAFDMAKSTRIPRHDGANPSANIYLIHTTATAPTSTASTTWPTSTSISTITCRRLVLERSMHVIIIRRRVQVGFARDTLKVSHTLTHMHPTELVVKSINLLQLFFLCVQSHPHPPPAPQPLHGGAKVLKLPNNNKF